MEDNKFKEVAMNPDNVDWDKMIERKTELYSRKDDVRSPFARDYTRILHSLAYRRLKHKTQVFFNIDNDHICTRMEHVAHVESVSNTIAKKLGLNTELTKAIAVGHDLGHAPFGHQGETIIDQLSQEHLKEKFWHERNGLRFVDSIELLEDNYRKYKNLGLTYAVRDGIISHCGEVDENGLKPRSEKIDLSEFKQSGQFQPATWEGCVVKISDKIAYIGRDIEDATKLGFIDEEIKTKLIEMASVNDKNVVNTTVIMHNLIIDICKNSTPDKGICLSEEFYKQMKMLKDFNYKYIYDNKRFEPFKKYAELVINEIFEVLMDTYNGIYSFEKIETKIKYYPILMNSFEKWLVGYCDLEIINNSELKAIALNCKNKKIYGKLSDEKIYTQAVLDFIAGMTDRFAVKVFNELLTY